MLLTQQAAFPRPEHPRPDWQRSAWLNLNGAWSFGFDPNDRGLDEQWYAYGERLDQALFREIIVPFSWVSPLSGIGEDIKGAAWYSRSVEWCSGDDNDRLFLRFGAVDYHCEVWINGSPAGRHSGGYGAFELEVTSIWKRNQTNTIVLRVEDKDEAYQARGKQGYGETRGVWQTVWLEARPQQYVDQVQFLTQLDGKVEVKGFIEAAMPAEASLRFSFAGGEVVHSVELSLEQGRHAFHTSFEVTAPRLWSPESPYLYEGTITLETGPASGGGTTSCDTVSTYFGIRTIGTIKPEGQSYRWITLNGKPVFLNGTLDQSYHPEGYFTYPSDEYMREEIGRLQRLGLNFVRIHIKPEEPRKLYWADKMGMLVMEDMPCFWGEPDEQAQAAYEQEAWETIRRDWNHPSIISWVMFNETWGLLSSKELTETDSTTGGKTKVYTPETQAWVKQVYEWAKEVDPTRLVEDNSPCRNDHVSSDLNTWHFYLNGYGKVRDHIEEAVRETYPGSAWNYIGGNLQSDAPLLNSECGAVWGIEGSAGDSDLAWQYRYMLNEFRRHDKICGFVFTELKDVINEFNGYYRIDDTEKDFGYDGFCPGMSLRDLHGPDFIVIDAPPCRTITCGEQIEVPLSVSSFTDMHHGKEMLLTWELWYDHLGSKTVTDRGTEFIRWNQYGVTSLPALTVTMPSTDATAVLAVELKEPADAAAAHDEASGWHGKAIARNFITFDVRSGTAHGRYRLDGAWLQAAPSSYASKQWDYSWHALEDHKVNGCGSGNDGGYFEYELDLSSLLQEDSRGLLDIYFEAGAKMLLSKDQQLIDDPSIDISYMHGRKADPGMNLNSYFMTDERKHPSEIHVYVNDMLVDRLHLEDDPADSRGVLSWHYQPDDRKLDEAGSYGYLQHIRVPGRLMPHIAAKGSLRLRLEVPAGLPEGSGGLCLYGRNAGRYPIDLLVHYRDTK